jgi:hypothetical protein
MRNFRLVVVGVVLFLAAPVQAAIVGVFTQVQGEVQLLRGENYLAAENGVELEPQDIVETGVQSSTQLDMEDGSVFRLGPGTRLAVSEYKLDNNKNVLVAGLDLLNGWMRFAVSRLRPEGNYSMRTPVLTIGVRGTEGVIEAENEQGGLHLHEGLVEVGSAGQDLPTAVPVRVSSGEYIRRQRGQAFQRLTQPPPEFVRRLPPGVQHKLVRQAQTLRTRGVSPRVIRAVTREDAQRYLKNHPHMPERLQQRFRPPVPGAAAGPRAVGERKDPMTAEGLRRRSQPDRAGTRAADPALVDRLPRRAPAGAVHPDRSALPPGGKPPAAATPETPRSRQEPHEAGSDDGPGARPNRSSGGPAQGPVRGGGGPR